MEQPALWESILIGVLVVLLLLWFRPGFKQAMRQSREAEKDWRGVLLPIGAVVLFVILVIMLAASG